MDPTDAFTDLIENVCKMNNEGAHFLIKRNESAAFEVLKETAEYIRQVIEKSTGYEAKSPIELRQTLKLLNSDKGYDPCFYSIQVPGLCSEDFYIHGKSLTIIPDHDIETLPQLFSELSCYLAIVFFNMAVALHMNGKKNGDTASLTYAVQMYTQCSQIIDLCNFHDDSDYMRMLLIMALNNQAQLYFELKGFDKSRAILDQLKVTMESHKVPLVDDSRDLVATMLNVLVFRRTALPPCA